MGRGMLLLGVALAAVCAVLVYYYTRWLVRLDATFRHVHPSKFSFSTLATFYASIGLAAALACSGLWLNRPTPDTPATRAICFLLVPVLLASAAAAVRVRHECYDS